MNIPGEIACSNSTQEIFMKFFQILNTNTMRIKKSKESVKVILEESELSK